MRNLKTKLLVTAVLSLGFAGTAAARDYDHEREHGGLDRQHGQGHWVMENRHDGVHGRLDAQHDAAHYYNPDISRRGHRRMHRQLERSHAWQDDRLNWQHNGLHRDLYEQHDDHHSYRDRYNYYDPH